MRKVFTFTASVFYLFASFIIPYMFLVFTEPTGANMFCMTAFFSISVLGCYAYTTTFIDLVKKNNK